MPDYSHPKNVLNFISQSAQETALVIVTGISGGTLRSEGSLMAVTPDTACGYISAGCVDGDIIFQARGALEDGEIRDLVYGEGSPFKDIALPCGGTIRIKIIPHPNAAAITKTVQALENRQKASLEIDGNTYHFEPGLRLRIVGRSAPFSALARLAKAGGFEIIGQSPDQDLNQPDFIRFDHLTHPGSLPDITDDPWTAVVFLFHDHDWEPALLAQALSGESFYIGAMGSDKTHAARIETLNAMNVTNTERIRGPIGLIPAMRDANMLAVSILAEIIDTARQEGRLL